MTESNDITGAVSAVRPCGTVVLVSLAGEDGRTIPIPFDHRPFQRLLEGEGCGPAGLVGRRVTYDGAAVHFIE
jgi:hypothetical protein